MFNWKKNDSRNTQFVEFLTNILIICNFCKTVTIFDTCSDSITAHDCFPEGIEIMLQYTIWKQNLKIILEMKYWSQNPKHLWVNMQIQPVPSVTTKQMINVTISFEIQLLKVSYLHIKKRKINLQLYSWLNW